MKILFLSLIFTFNICYSQSVAELETRRNSYLEKLSSESAVLVSLTGLIEDKARQVEKEKNKKNPDDEKIVQLMSSSATISNKIDEKQKVIKQLEKNIEQLNTVLLNKYSTMIDSLKELKYKPGKNNAAIEESILELTEKKLLITPGIHNLTFNPSKVFKIDLNRLKDEKEKEAYSEYLRNALKEINVVINNVDEKRQELNEIITLQKKTKKFLEEAEFETVPGAQKYSVTPKNERASFGEMEFDVANEALISQIHTYNFLLNQVNTRSSPEINVKWQVNYDDDRQVDLKSYKELLDELKKSLMEYKSALSNKINSVK